MSRAADGPRPYECVKRACHSKRHQPIRGSLIQEIFKIMNEIHKPSTKKNKEWQEKLPVVVLKAEEIIYFKANSEAEYVNLETFWERTNDAIETIIRRYESSETGGDLLQPCIEAALNLGSTPRRASRSQRNTNPRCNYLRGAFTKPPTYGSSIVKNRDFTVETTPPSNNVQRSIAENYLTSEKRSVYPLYYGKAPQVVKPQSYGNVSASGNFDGTSECDVEYDLSLRLGTCSVLCPDVQKSNMTKTIKDRPLFSKSNVDDPLNTEEANTKKRKTFFSRTLENHQQLCWQSKLPCGHLNGRKKRAGLSIVNLLFFFLL